MAAVPKEPAKEEGARTHAAMLVVASVVPALLAAAHAANVADAGHDEGVVRAVGLGWAGALRALDAALAAVVALLPIGTRAMRASLAAALLVGLAGGAIYATARKVLAACASMPRFGAVVACAASLAATVGASWQLEGASPGGTVLGAVLALLPFAILTGGGDAVRFERAPLAALAAGAALAYEPLAGATAFASMAALAIGGRGRGAPDTIASWKGRPTWRAVRVAALFASAGAVPFALACARMRAAHELVASVGPFAGLLGEAGASGRASPIAFVEAELGWIAAGLAIAGAALGVVVARTRPVVVALSAIVAVGVGAVALGAPAGPTRYASPVLAAVAAAFVLAAIAMQALVRLVSRSRVPFARASAAMVVLLELTFPVHMADDASARAFARAQGTAATWDDVAVGPLPVGAVVLVDEPRVMLRLLASRAAGELRPDLAVVPTFDLGGPLARRELAYEPTLASFFRDMALAQSPEEFSLSEVAATRPLAVVYDPRWPRPLARQMIPLGLFERFETEPRGMSDRRRALETFVPARDRLALAITRPEDPELVSLTASLLRARAIGLAATNDRDLVARGIDDVRMFDEEDAVALKIARRVASAKGAIDVRDLAP